MFLSSLIRDVRFVTFLCARYAERSCAVFFQILGMPKALSSLRSGFVFESSICEMSSEIFLSQKDGSLRRIT